MLFSLTALDFSAIPEVYHKAFMPLELFLNLTSVGPKNVNLTASDTFKFPLFNHSQPLSTNKLYFCGNEGD